VKNSHSSRHLVWNSSSALLSQFTQFTLFCYKPRDHLVLLKTRQDYKGCETTRPVFVAFVCGGAGLQLPQAVLQVVLWTAVTSSEHKSVSTQNTGSFSPQRVKQPVFSEQTVLCYRVCRPGTDSRWGTKHKALLWKANVSSDQPLLLTCQHGTVTVFEMSVFQHFQVVFRENR